MSTEIPSRPQTVRTLHERPWANGYALFAVTAMIVLGLWQILAGIAMSSRDAPYDAVPRYILSAGPAVWGWALVLMGIVTVGACVAVLQDRAWGRTAAIVSVVLSMILNFVLLPSSPIFSVVIIALDVVVVFALTAYRRDIG